MTQFVGQAGGLAGSLKRQRASQVAGFAAVTIAASAFVGWWVSLPMLSGWGFATVKPTTALCLVALGLALVHPGKNSRLAFAVGLAVAAIAALDLLDLFGIDSGSNHLNRLLVPQAGVPGPETSFHMINGVPIALALTGGALAFSCFERYYFAATALGGLAGVMQVFALLNYLSGVRTLYGSVGWPTPLTAVGLLCVVSAIILRIGTIPALRKPRPLRHLLIVLGCAIAAPLLLFGAYAGSRVADAQLDQVRDNLTSEARTLSGEVDREIVGEIEKLQALSVSPSLGQGDFAAFQRQAEASLAFRQGGNIMLVDRNMQQLVNTWVPYGTALEKVAFPEPVERALATGEPQIASLFTAPVTQQLVLGIIVPVQIDGENRYALVRPVDQRAIAGLVAAHAQQPGLHAAISDATRRIIVQSEQDGAFVGKALLAAQWHCPGPGGVVEFTDPGGPPCWEHTRVRTGPAGKPPFGSPRRCSRPRFWRCGGPSAGWRCWRLH